MHIDDLYRMLRAGHSQLQSIVDTVADPMVVLDQQMCVQTASRAFYHTFHVDPYDTVGHQLYDLGDGQWDIPEFRLLLEEVIPRTSVVIDYAVTHDFPGVGQKTFLVTARTLVDQDSVSRKMLVTFVDATERLQGEALNRLLFGELKHRIKNLFATVRALARQATTEGRTAEQFRDDFLGRFSNLVRSFDVAFEVSGSLGFRGLVETTLSPFAGSYAIALNGQDDVDPGPTVLVSLSLVLHELATNAVKYGSLSVPGGSVLVDWRYDPERKGLQLSWSERGGPPVTAPSRTGYGTKLVTALVTHNLGGSMEQTYGTQGFASNIFIPLKDHSSPGLEAFDVEEWAVEESADRRG